LRQQLSNHRPWSSPIWHTISQWHCSFKVVYLLHCFHMLSMLKLSNSDMYLLHQLSWITWTLLFRMMCLYRYRCVLATRDSHECHHVTFSWLKPICRF
jgi:hypothetical protein